MNSKPQFRVHEVATAAIGREEGCAVKERMKAERQTEESSDQSKREFITKLVTAAGAVAAVGLAAGGSGEAAEGTLQFLKISGGGTSLIKWHKVSTGFRLTMSGAQLGRGLQQMGITIEDRNLANAQLTIEFSY